MKYHIPQIPYNIAIPNGGGTGAPVQAPPSRLPQHLRSAVTNGLCRLQPADPPAAAPGPWSDPPDPLTLREEHLIGQLLAQLDGRAPGRHTPNQLVIQALQHHLNDNIATNQPVAQPQAPHTTTTSASAACVAHTVRPAEIVDGAG